MVSQRIIAFVKCNKRRDSRGKKWLFLNAIMHWLLDEIAKHYEQFDDELKAELPLKRVWILVEELD